MTWILTTVLLATIIAWAMNISQRNTINSLHEKIAQLESDYNYEIHNLTTQYNEMNKRLQIENERLRRGFL